MAAVEEYLVRREQALVAEGHPGKQLVMHVPCH